MTARKKYRNHKYLLRALFALILFPISLFASNSVTQKYGNVVRLSKEKSERYDISDAMQYLEDTSGRITINQLITGAYDIAFTSKLKKRGPFQNQTGYFWARLKIYSEDEKNDNWNFVVHPTGDWSMDTVAFYYPDAQGRYGSPSMSGYDIPLYKRELNTAATVFPIPMNKGEQVLYLRYHKGKWMDITPKMAFFIESNNAYNRAHRDEFWLQGIYLGAIIILILYNIFVFFAFHDKTHPVLIATVFIYALFWLSRTNILTDIFIPENPALNLKIFFYSIIPVFNILGIMYPMFVLRLKNYLPKVYNAQLIFVLITTSLYLVQGVFGYTQFLTFIVNIFSSLQIAFNIIGISIGIRKKVPDSKIILFSYLILFPISLMFYMAKLGGLKPTLFTSNAFQIGTAFQFTMFTFVLSSRLNLLRKEKEEAQKNQLAMAHENERLVKEQNEILEIKVKERTVELEDEKQRSESLLLNILPAETATELMKFGKATARSYEKVSVMFADIKDFSKIAELLSPEILVQELDRYFKAFDDIVTKYGIEKIKTIGDAYLCVSGLPGDAEKSAEKAVSAALEMQEFVCGIKRERSQLGDPFFEVRIGIHTGPIVAGVVGNKKFAYDIWGDTVNIAARMEQNSEPGRINISEETWNQVKTKFNCLFRGPVDAKNIGLLNMYFVECITENIQA